MEYYASNIDFSSCSNNNFTLYMNLHPPPHTFLSQKTYQNYTAQLITVFIGSKDIFLQCSKQNTKILTKS